MKPDIPRRHFCIGAAALLLAACVSPPKKETAMTAPKRIFIIHGYGASPEDHWFPWLAEQLQAQGLRVQRIALPDSHAPDFARWQQALAAAIGTPGAEDIFIAHSLGTISLLHYLSHTRPARIGALVLASGFAGKLPGLSEINGYSVDDYVAQVRLDLPAIRAMTPHMTSIISDNDPIVAPEESQKLANSLSSAVIRISQGGHLLASDGFTQLPQALQAVMAALPGDAF
ncbi:esterase [Vandammella animalimorsus]|uniref:Esterase n=2 Tax=Vandammella animalimorsus TaxID=2029117 RepID=A0A2A2T7I9_9BURK|nr:esterase [Vandammella animalimorsus]PAX17817.1 esterase [Vandammella animalimorsus]PAX19971.1 esterase [Vandammella animalimorsus]